MKVHRITSYNVCYTKLLRVVHDRERAALLHVRVEVAGIRCQHHHAAPRANPHRLQAFSVSANVMDLDTRRDLRGPVVKLHALVEDAADRITSYNVCYTKLLRAFPFWLFRANP